MRTRSRAAVMRRRMRRLVVIMLMILAFCSGFLGHTLLAAHAETPPQKKRSPYYTSIQLKQGDSLWKIAGQYMEGSGYSQEEYVQELIRMNRLKSLDIHAGEYLTVVYFAD